MIEPPPPAPDNTTTARQAGRQARVCKAPRRTHSYIPLTRSCVKQTRGDEKQALELGEETPLGITILPLILRVWRINISCSTSKFFSQFTNTDRKRHRKFSPGSAGIGQTPCHLTNVDWSTSAPIIARELDPCCICNKTFKIIQAKLKPVLYCHMRCRVVSVNHSVLVSMLKTQNGLVHTA